MCPQVAEVTKSIERLLEQIQRSTGQTPEAEAKRATWRYKWAAPATVEFVDPKDSSGPVCITTRTISAQGLDFCSPNRPKPGCKVLINLETDEGELQIPATVVYCTESVGMPSVGVRFDLD